MPKSEYPKSVQDLPKNDYEQWTVVYHSARDEGDNKETAAKKAWGAIKENSLQEKNDDDPCWEDHEMVGIKRKNGKKVPNCVPKKEGLNNMLNWKTLKEALADDIVGADELQLYIENDRQLYRQRTVPIMKNLARKMVKGTYDADKAVALWMYLVNDAAKKYVKEFGGPNEKWHKVFSKIDRLQTAQKLARNFEAEIRNQDYDVKELAGYKRKELEETQALFIQDKPSSDDSRRIAVMETFMTEVGLSYRELLEDVVTSLDRSEYKDVLAKLKDKYGYR